VQIGTALAVRPVVGAEVVLHVDDEHGDRLFVEAPP
jgi:hypothetical protein